MKKIKQVESRFNAKERVAAYQELVKGEYGLNSRLLLPAITSNWTSGSRGGAPGRSD